MMCDFLYLWLQLIQGAHMDSGVEPRASALEQLPQTLGEQSLLLLKVFYTTAEQAQTGSWDTVLCSEDDLTVGLTTVSIERREVAAVMRSGSWMHVSIIFDTLSKNLSILDTHLKFYASHSCYWRSDMPSSVIFCRFL